MSKVDFAIVGAGPAGIAAACLATELGLETLIVDEQDAPGGQIYRGVERAQPDTPLGPDYLAGQDLVRALRTAPVDYRPKTTVWHIDGQDLSLCLERGGRTETIGADRILLATGALERPVPIPGWTLPGVLAAGGAQVLLKTAGLVPDGRTVLAGQGPLLYLLAGQLARAGAPPAALLETTPLANWFSAARHFVGLWSGRRMALKGLGLTRAVHSADIPIYRAARGLRAVGRGSLERIAWEGGEIAADHLLLHEGVIPNVQISLALQLRHEWDLAQLCWRPSVDEWGCTSLTGISVAGDSGGIAGAQAAVLSGKLAALDAAAGLGRIAQADRDRRARPIRRRLASERALRPFLDTLYRPSPAILAPSDDAIVACRCEEVTVGQIRRAARLGAIGPNQLKAFTRCGMGPCQGRICGSVVTATIADTLKKPMDEIGCFRPRAPYKPITVGALADFETGLG